MARSTEEIQTELEEVVSNLRELQTLPPYYVIHGNVIDNRERIDWLQRRKIQLDAELSGTSAMQGPDLVV